MSISNNRSRRDRIFWLTSGGVAVVVFLVLTVTPAVIAQDDSSTERLLGIFENVFRFVEDNYVDEVEAEALLEGALRGLFDSLDDPHSAYLDADEMRSLTDTTTGEYGGVGMYISKQESDDNATNGFIEVVSPIEDTPAYTAGVRAGDVIMGIRDQDADEFITTEDLSIDEVVDRLRGEPGTTVTINIRRGESTVFDITLARAVIEYPTVKYAMIGEDIGFLRIISFTPRTIERVEEALDHFKSNDYQSMIIDVRGDPGGLLDSVIEVADLFFTGGTIVGTQARSLLENERFVAEPGVAIPEEMPVIVLIDEGSASASEILAGALQDRRRALLVGQTTYGKGSVQQIRRIGTGGFRLTMSRYYLPSGRFIDKVGVDPDVEIVPPELTDEQSQLYTELLSSERVISWAADNLKATEGELTLFVDELQEDSGDIPDRWLRRLVKNEINRQNNDLVVYDLDFDIVLQEAVRMLRQGEVTVGR